MSQALTLIDGRPGDRVAVDDRGLQYGDGVFRTLRVQAGQPLWWPDHLIKLQDDCARLVLACSGADLWAQDLAQLPAADGTLKLIVTRGSGPRGYAPQPDATSRRILSFQPGEPRSYPSQGLTLRICDLRLGHQPRLAGIKHLNRLENVLARGEWQDPAIHEALLLDQGERVIGGTQSNLFLWQGERLLTPRLERCGVAGVTRARLMRLAQVQGVPVVETDLTMADVIAADEVMLCNSLMGLRRVDRLAERCWGDAVISTRLAGWLDA